MKLVTFSHQSQERIGVVGDADHIIDLVNAYGLYLREFEGNPHGAELAAIRLGRDMCDFLKRGDQSLAAARQAVDYIRTNPAGRDDRKQSGIVLNREQIRLQAPVPRPGALISAGKNFSDHVAEMSKKTGPGYPVAFLKLPGTVIGPEDDIPYPRETEKLDYEVELAVVIGKRCADVRAEEALDYAVGYSAFNDISARDVIRSENKNGIHLMGKAFPALPLWALT